MVQRSLRTSLTSFISFISFHLFTYFILFHFWFLHLCTFILLAFLHCNKNIEFLSGFLMSFIRVFQIAVRGGGWNFTGGFFTRWRKPEEEYFWWFKPFSKLKTAICECWTSIKIKINMTYVSKELTAFSRLQLLQRAPSIVGFLDPPLYCNKFAAKAVSWFKPKRMVMYTCIPLGKVFE